MNDQQLTKYGRYLFDIKTYQLQDTVEWTTHVYIFRDTLDGIEPLTKGEMGNRCSSEQEARLAGLIEAKRFVDAL